MNKNLLRTFLFSAFTLISFVTIAQSKNIKVSDFVINAKEQKVTIDWKTDGSVATNYFAVQKSTDGVNYKTVAIVMGPDPKQKSCECYGCVDKSLTKGAKQSYYRLIHIDSDGNEQITQAKVLATP